MTQPRLLWISLIVVSILIAPAATAQVSEGGTPPSFRAGLSMALSGAATVETAPVDVEALLAEDEIEQQKGIPYRFGYPFEVNYTMENSGTWTTLPDGGRLWRLQIVSPEAYSINLVYSEYDIPPGAQFFVYNGDASHIIGAFTERNNKEHGQFATAPVRGDVSILEYYEPADALYAGRIDIQRIVHAYRDLFSWDVVKETVDFGNSGSCNNNVNCPEGAGWEEEIRSVAMILTSGGFRLCSGALVNNVREDLTPYFLTANHCLGGEETWVFMFNYESPSCANIDGPTWMTVSGSTLRASYFNSDFALLELIENPPDSYNVFYAGWSAADVAAQSSVGIHHPSGDIKKISFDYNAVVSTNYAGGSGGSHWRVVAWDDGTTEPGSSGSPLFDSLTHRIVGQLHGGTASCASITSDYYGKFAKSWDVGGSASTRLKDWLDPDNTGTLQLDGIDPAGANFTVTPQHGNVPLNVQFDGSSQLTVDSWTWDFGDGDSAFVQSPLHTYTTPGAYDVSLQIIAGVDTVTRVRYDYVIALADTIGAPDTILENSGTVEVVVNGANSIPINTMHIPVFYQGSIPMTLSSFSTDGCRTDYFEVQHYIHSYSTGKQATIELKASNSDTSPALDPGSGPIVKLIFSVSGPQAGDSTLVDLSGYSSYQPLFQGPLLAYEPEIESPMLLYPVCCVGERGDADSSGEINVADLTMMISYLFQGGSLPDCEEEADVDGSGVINVSDVTYVVDFLFKGGANPVPCP